MGPTASEKSYTSTVFVINGNPYCMTVLQKLNGFVKEDYLLERKNQFYTNLRVLIRKLLKT